MSLKTGFAAYARPMGPLHRSRSVTRWVLSHSPHAKEARQSTASRSGTQATVAHVAPLARRATLRDIQILA